MTSFSEQFNNQLFIAQSLYKQGQLSKCKHIYQQLLIKNQYKLDNHFNINILLNLSTIQLQLNNLSIALQLINKCISIVPFNYQPYYTKALINLQNNQLTDTYNNLKISLSCLLAQIVSYKINEQHFTLINKSIKLSNNNLKAYLIRAKIQQRKGKYKLAENDIQRVIYAIQQQDHQNNIYNNYISVTNNLDRRLLQSVYLQKVLFYRRTKSKKLQETFEIYIKIRQQNINTQNINNKFTIKFPTKQSTQLTLEQIQTQIRNMAYQIKQAIQQLNKVRQNHKTKEYNLIQSKENNIQPNYKIRQTKQYSIQRLTSQRKRLLESQRIGSTGKLLANKELDNINNSLLQSSELSEINIKNNKTFQQLSSNLKINHNLIYEQQNLLLNPIDYPNQSNFTQNQDEDSLILNQKIQQLQNEIKLSGGNISQFVDLSKNNNEDNANFLQYQIQKNMQQIINIKKQQNRKNRQRIRASANIVNSDSKSTDSKIQALTIKSILSEKCILTENQIKDYKSFKLQIRSFTMFDQKMNKKQAYIKAKYHQKIFQTDKCKTDKFTWNQNFADQTIIQKKQEKNKKQFDNFQENYYIDVELHAKEFNWLGRSSDIIIGKGVIKITSKGQTKCTIQNKNQKIGVLYYKIKLHRKQ